MLRKGLIDGDMSIELEYRNREVLVTAPIRKVHQPGVLGSFAWKNSW